MAKAFDFANHDILLDKLTQYGVVSGAHAWFENYLCGYQQAVKLGNWNSRKTGMGAGTCKNSSSSDSLPVKSTELCKLSHNYSIVFYHTISTGLHKTVYRLMPFVICYM